MVDLLSYDDSQQKMYDELVAIGATYEEAGYITDLLYETDDGNTDAESLLSRHRTENAINDRYG